MRNWSRAFCWRNFIESCDDLDEIRRMRGGKAHHPSPTSHRRFTTCSPAISRRLPPLRNTRRSQSISSTDEDRIRAEQPRRGVASLETLVNDSPAGRWLMMSDVCKHCSAAPRATACPTGALIIYEFSTLRAKRYLQRMRLLRGRLSVRSDRSQSDLRSRAQMHPVLRPPARRHDPACAKACPTRSIQFGPIDVLEACDESVRGPQVYHAMARDRLRAIGHSMGAATLLAIASSAGDLSAAHNPAFHSDVAVGAQRSFGPAHPGARGYGRPPK